MPPVLWSYLGPSKLLFRNSTGWIARAVEKWQVGFNYYLPWRAQKLGHGTTSCMATDAPMSGPWDNQRAMSRGAVTSIYFGADNTCHSQIRSAPES
jgi:hypothetical protein